MVQALVNRNVGVQRKTGSTFINRGEGAVRNGEAWSEFGGHGQKLVGIEKDGRHSQRCEARRKMWDVVRDEEAGKEMEKLGQKFEGPDRNWVHG